MTGRPVPLPAPAPWAIDLVPGGPDLVLAFASIGHDPTRPPSPEFRRTATAGGRSALLIRDGGRRWGEDAGFAPALTGALAAVRQRQPVARILAMGASMGAFLALRAATLTPVDAVLAIGPQHQPAARWETRWRPWTDPLPPGLTAPLPEAPWLILMHGLADDRDQALAFPRRKGLDHLLLPAIAHADLAAHLKARGGLQGLVDAAMAGDRRRLLRIARTAGAISRDQLPR